MTTAQSYNLGYSEGYHLRFVLQIPKGLNDEAYSRGYAMGGKVRKAYKLLPPELQKCRCCNQDKGVIMRYFFEIDSTAADGTHSVTIYCNWLVGDDQLSDDFPIWHSAGYATCVEAMADGEDKIKELESEG